MPFLARDEYTGSGITGPYTVSFAYLAQTHVEVYLDGVLQTVTTNYTWPTSSTIQFTSTVAGGVAILILRNTPTAAQVDFQDATILTENALDTAILQALYVSEEAEDAQAGTIQLDTDNKWDAQTAPIKNVVDPTNNQDAATKKYGDDNWGGAAASAAAASAAAASTSEGNAATSASNASTSESNALTSANNASTSASNASTAQTNAEAARDAVKSNTLHAFWFGPVPASTTIYATEMVEATDLPASLTDSKWACKVAPSTAVTLSLQKNAVEVATITFNASSTTANTYTNAALDSFVADDEFSIVTPADTFGMEGLKATTVFV